MDLKKHIVEIPLCHIIRIVIVPVFLLAGMSNDPPCNRNEMMLLASFGVENQTRIESSMPIRIMGYDYGTYRGMLDAEKPLAPVITIVLNLFT